MELRNGFQRRGFVFGKSGQEVSQPRLHEKLTKIKAVYGQGQGFDFVHVGCLLIGEQKILPLQPAQSPLSRGTLPLEHLVSHLDAKAAR
jgi:hypothetical protein